MINPLNRDKLRSQFRNARPFPFIVIDNLLVPGAAEEVARAYPSFEQAGAQGFMFNFVNEQKKIQITDSSKFPQAVRQLNDAISAPQFLADLEYITGIPRLLADEQLVGGGMHLTGPGGRLDVHVDFNLIEDRKLFRRLNILLYLNPVWQESWGGQIELWDRDVKNRVHSCSPAINRCLIFETSEFSYHGVGQVMGPPENVRQSFAAYYYTREPPPNWSGKYHSTIFRARPDERFRGLVQMPVEKIRRRIMDTVQHSKQRVKSWMGIS